MIVCKVCGTENEQGASFCGSCGAFLEWSGEAVAADETQGGVPSQAPGPPAATPTAASPATASPPPPSEVPPSTALMEPGMIACPACGQPNEPTRVFCRRCATELAPVAAVTGPVAAEAPRARSVPPVALLGGLAGVALLGVLAVAFLLPKASPSSPAGVSPSVPATGQASAEPSGASVVPSDQPTATTSEPAACTAPTGLIAFTALKGTDADLWIWDAQDGSVRPLVTGSGSQSDATWSPDGKLLVYRGPDGLRLVRADGSPVDVPDFTHHAEDRHPAWSPDGKVVVFATNRKPLTSLDIVSRLADDNQAPLKSLVNNKAQDWGPAFSPDGSRIAFVSKRTGDAHLFLMKADGSGEAEIKLGSGVFGDPAISPDGEWIAFTRRDSVDTQKDLWKAHLDGSGMTQLSTTDADENDLAWSPDSACIAVARADSDARIVLVDAATGKDVSAIGIEGDQNQQPAWR